MSYMKMECPNCHAPLELDTDKLIMFCPYCGSKLTFDSDQMMELIKAKEETKRIQYSYNYLSDKDKETEITKRYKSKYDAGANSIKATVGCLGKIIIGIIILAVLFALVMVVSMIISMKIINR